ncbi:MAG: ribonucleotide reductase N-terminal alpha domain-containing protein, partial [Candidatus Korarchaeota archaeon]|nr:ribonucleotide reductase N-terminal alpha domain-containing protein [Candidatus Korarchaeota archaeon]
MSAPGRRRGGAAVYEALIEEALRRAGLDEDPRLVLEAARGASGEPGDAIERVLVLRSLDDPRWMDAAREFLLARIYVEAGLERRRPLDEERRLGYQALRLLHARYLLRDSRGGLVEIPAGMFRRVARHVASAEMLHGASQEEAERLAEEFYRLMAELRFLPNSPTLMNAGTPLSQLAACFVVPVYDDTDAIFEAAKVSARIQRTGAGTGFDFSGLRPRGEYIGGVGGRSSGPVSFMEIFDTAAEVLKSGGKRRGAMMGILHAWHPDIWEFVESKCSARPRLQNFNISVAVYDAFMEAVEKGGEWPLINPRKTFLLPGEPFDSRFYAIVRARHSLSEEWVAEYIARELEEHGGSIALHESLIITIDEAIAIAENEEAIQKHVDAKELFWKIVHGAWDSGDPGMIFIDEINRRHPTWYLGKIQSTNPCVSGDTRITTSRGLIRADELREGDLVWTPFGWAPVKKVLDNGEKEIYRLEFENGVVLNATPEHELFTPEGWVPVKNIHEGTRVRVVIEPVSEYPHAEFDNPLKDKVGDEELAE